MLCELPRCFANFLLSPFNLLGVETWAPPSNTYLLSMQVMKGEEVNGLGHTTQNLKTFYSIYLRNTNTETLENYASIDKPRKDSQKQVTLSGGV